MKKQFTAIILALTLSLMITACSQPDNQSSNQSLSSTESDISIEGSQDDVSMAAPDAAQSYEWLFDDNIRPTGPDINGAPVKDLTDLMALTTVYVWPLTQNGEPWFKSWVSPSELSPNALIHICAFNPLVEFDIDDPFVAAVQVETAIQRHFDVSIEYLRTASAYNAEENVYQMPEGGGGWTTVAMSAEQQGEQVVIKVGKLGPEETVPTPLGTLILQVENQSNVKYNSFELD